MDECDTGNVDGYGVTPGTWIYERERGIDHVTPNKAMLIIEAHGGPQADSAVLLMGWACHGIHTHGRDSRVHMTSRKMV